MNAPSWSLFEDMFWGEVKFKYQLNTMTFSGSLLLLSDTDGPLIWIHWRRWRTQKHNAVLHEGKQTSSFLAEDMVWGFFTSQNVSNKKKTKTLYLYSYRLSFHSTRKQQLKNKLNTFRKVGGLQMLEQRSHFISIWLRLVTHNISRLGGRSQWY